MPKFIITEDLKDILLKVDDEVSNILLNIDIDTLDNKDFINKELNYLDLSHTHKGFISYLTKEKLDTILSNNKSPWEVNLRYHGRPGSVIKKLFKLKDSQIQVFSTRFMSIVDPPSYHFEVIKGEDISKYYHYSHTYEMCGSLGGSCMNHSPKNYFDIYVENDDVINMIIMKDDKSDRIMGRALLWAGKDFKMMDRIYTCNDNHVNYFYEWAKNNGYYYKQFNNFNSPKHIMYNDVPIIKEFEIQLKLSNFEKYPYLDTFKWLDIKKNKLYNHIPQDITNVKIISDNCGGYFKGDFYAFSDMSNFVYTSNDIVLLRYLNKTACSYETHRSKSLDMHIYTEHSVYDDELKDYIFNKEFDYFNDKEKIEKRKEDIKSSVINKFRVSEKVAEIELDFEYQWVVAPWRVENNSETDNDAIDDVDDNNGDAVEVDVERCEDIFVEVIDTSTENTNRDYDAELHELI